MSKFSMKTVNSKRLSKHLLDANVSLTEREARIIDHWQKLSDTTWIGYIDDKLLCAWGITQPSILSKEIYLWLHTTDVVDTNQFIFIRRSQIFVQDLLKEYEAITGHVNVHAASSKKWLKWLGARFGAVRGNLMEFRIERHG